MPRFRPDQIPKPIRELMTPERVHELLQLDPRTFRKARGRIGHELGRLAHEFLAEERRASFWRWRTRRDLRTAASALLVASRAVLDMPDQEGSR